MSPKQKKLAAKAPPPNKLDEKDFKVLREEKAKGRGMGLQDEKLKPGKVYKAKYGKMMKARVGKSIKADPTKPISSVKPLGSLGKGIKVSAAHSRVLGKMSNKKLKEMVKTGINPDLKGDPNIKRGSQKTSMEAKSFLDRRKQLASPKDVLKAAKATRYGKIALGIAGAALGAKELLKSKMKKEDKKMAGGMAKKYSIGTGPLGATKKPKTQPAAGRAGLGALGGTGRKEEKNKRLSADEVFKIKDSKKKFTGPKATKNSLGDTINILREIDQSIYAKTGGNYMGGGMMQKPMGYKHGDKVRGDIKLGRALIEAFGSKKTINKMKANIQDQNRVKKHMGGGMMKKYSVGGGADMGDPKKPTAIPKGKDSELMVHNMMPSQTGERPLAAPQRRRARKDKQPRQGLKSLRQSAGPGYLPKPAAPKSKMVGGMAKKYSKGGGFDMGGKRDFDKITERTKIYAKAGSMKDRDRLTARDIEQATNALKPSQRKMGGGMMNKPMGYKHGTMVKARGCKLGRTRPTKMY